MLGALEVELGKRRITRLVVHTRNFKTLAVARYATRLEHIIPALRIPMHREGTAFAQRASHTQFTLAEFIALATVDKEMRLGTRPLCEGA